MTTAPSDPTSTRPGVAFVLGGGGVLGANEVGMLQALCDAGVTPDVVVGTSVGAINGAMVAAGFDTASMQRLVELWARLGSAGVIAGSSLQRLRTLARSRTHLHGNERLRALLEEHLPVTAIEDLAIPFHCVAASIERAGAHWFSAGPIADAVLASAAVPGLLPPMEIAGEHFYDGGLVHSIPVSRAVQLGASTVYVLQVGRVEEGLSRPRTPLQVGLVAFEIARRHRFTEEMAQLPPEVEVHLLPTGEQEPQADLRKHLRYREAGGIRTRIARAHAASKAYLDGLGRPEDRATP